MVVPEPRVFGGERGFFMETWNQARYEEAGLPVPPEMGLRWPIENPTLSGKDALAPPLSGMPGGSPAANPTG